VTYPRGTVAMLRASKVHSTGSQLLIILKDSQLPPRYTPLGTVATGMTIVDAVAAKGVMTGKSVGPPALPLKILKVSLVA